jgi:hypothetical protein
MRSDSAENTSKTGGKIITSSRTSLCTTRHPKALLPEGYIPFKPSLERICARLYLELCGVLSKKTFHIFSSDHKNGVCNDAKYSSNSR